MTKIRLYEHPLAVVEPKVLEVESLAEWLLSHYGEAPSVKVQIFSGEPSEQTEITGDVAAIMQGDAPEYVVLQSPGGVDPVSWVIIAIGAVLVTAAVISLIPKPEVPSAAVNRTQSSPNNSLGDRSNRVRMLERVEDIYGTVKSIPSLMMPTYSKYINHLKYEYGYYCVSRGYCDVDDLKDGDTLISQIAGASASIYHPFTSPNYGSPVAQVGSAIADKILTVTRANEVDGITLKARNQITAIELVYSFVKEFSTVGRISQALKNPNFNEVVAVGDSVTVTMVDNVAVSGPASVTVSTADKSFTINSGPSIFSDLEVGNTFTLSGFADAANNGTFTVATKPASNKVTVSSTTLVSTTETSIFCAKTRNYSGTYTVSAVGDGYIQVNISSASWSSPINNHTCLIPQTGISEYTDWVTLPDSDRTKVWGNVIAQNGMYKDNGSKLTTSVTFEIQIEKLDALTLLPLSTPIVETQAGTLSGSVTDERALTMERTTAWAGPCRVRMRRTTPYDSAFSGTVQDEIKWADLYSVSPVSKNHFGNKTTIHTVTQATTRATAVKSRQLNCIASRRLPVYNGTTFSGALDADGLLTSGTISATSKLCDIIAAVSVDKKIGARTLADVDMAQIWGVQQQLDAWNSACGQFNYTLDSDTLSYEETLVLIANAGFCIAYRQNGKVRLAFDRLQTASTALFTHRNKKPNAETITRRFANDADYDGVEFTYMDPDSQQNETITLPLDGSYTKLKKYEIAGIRSFTQAWYRANREYRKLIGQRLSIETSTTMDARALLPNARVDIVDNTRYKSYDGEVTGQNGLEITLSKAVEFTPGQSHSIVLMRRDGSLQSIPVTPGSTSKSVVLQSLPSEALVTSYGTDGVRSIYSFAADSARGAMAWLVQEVDVSDGQYCAIKAINYSPDYYASDTLAVPPKATIIN